MQVLAYIISFYCILFKYLIESIANRFVFTFFRNKLIVSPCGFDNSTWDPSKDNFIPRNFSVEDMEGKTVCKAALQQHLGLSEHASSILVCLHLKLSKLVFW